MGKAQSKGQDFARARHYDGGAPVPPEERFSRTGQTTREDWRGPYSKEVKHAPELKQDGAAYARGQEYSGPYTTSKYDRGSKYPDPIDKGGNPILKR